MLYSYLVVPFLAILISGSRLTTRQLSIVNLQAKFQTTDITSSGSYNIIFCDAHGAKTPHNKAHILQALFPLFKSQLEQLLLDVQVGTRSRFGYEALFKTRRNKKIVKSVFQKIPDGAPVKLGTERAQRLGVPTAQPMFVCLNEGIQRTAKLLADCVADGVLLHTFEGWETIFICPRFWHLPFGFQPYQCPKVDSNNKLSGTDLSQSMYSAIIHELVHMYYQKTAVALNETYETQGCVDLDAKTSTLNAENYATYASGELSLESV